MEGGTIVPKMGQGVLGDGEAFFYSYWYLLKHRFYLSPLIYTGGMKKGRDGEKGIEQNHLKNLQCLSVSL